MDFLTDIFNSILSNEQFPEVWSCGIIVPIHKKGDTKCTGNYRGITLLPVLAKLFTSIMANRLQEWAEEANKLPINQFGFRSNHRTTDAIFVIQSLIEQSKNFNSSLFCCFIDFQKAFDSIDQERLWWKLKMLGISSNFLNTVISMYSQAKACVRIRNTVSGTFQCSKGVKQGCPLSPILFCLFISDIFQEIGTGLPGIEIGKQLIHGLLYADDAVLMSKNEKDMASLLRQLEVYCSKWNLKVNTSKTKMMRIGDASKKTTFKYIGVELDEVTEFNYLGFHINNAGDLSRGMGYRADAARKAYYSLTQILRRLTGLTIPDCCYIFTA